ncbi:MAG: phosphatase PAP2 family protein [Acidobacteriota bacterium]
MAADPRAGWRKWLGRIRPKDRAELTLLVGGVVFLLLILCISRLASEVFEGETQRFDQKILVSLRSSTDPAVPIGPTWLTNAALDVTALGSATVLGLVVLAVGGFLVLQGMWRTGLFVVIASSGGLFINAALKHYFQRPRPDIVSHLREVMTTSFPSGHALTSAVVYLTLGALTMRIAKRRITKFYCMGIAMLTTALVGASRVFLGVHYPTDVVAGWMIGLSWALLCWLVERSLERRSGWTRERAEAEASERAP